MSETGDQSIPYLYGDLTKMYRSILKIIIKDGVVNETNGYQLPKLDKEENLKKGKNFTIGFATEGIIKDIEKKVSVTKGQMKCFYEYVETCAKAIKT